MTTTTCLSNTKIETMDVSDMEVRHSNTREYSIVIMVYNISIHFNSDALFRMSYFATGEVDVIL